MPTRRFYANTPPQRTLSTSLTSSGTSLTVSGTFAGWPASFPYFAVLEIGTANAEIVSVTGVSGSVATIVRGQDGTVAVAHSGGATFDQVVVAKDLDEANAHTSANTGVHGISGAVVGTSDAQTLTNKTLTAPALTSPVITGSGTAALASVTTTGNATVGGTLGATGAITTAAGVTAGTDLTASGVKLNKPPLFIGKQATGQSLPSSTFTSVAIDTEIVDTANGHDTVTNNSRYTAQVAGWYEVSGVCMFSGSSTNGQRAVVLAVNGAQLSYTQGAETSVGTGNAAVFAHGTLQLAVGDYVEVQAFQNSGGALSTSSGFSSLTVRWVSA